MVVATVSSDSIALSAAAKTAGMTDPVAIEPPEVGPSGSDVSPSATSTFSSGTPAFSARKLRQDRVRAGADVLRAAGDARQCHHRAAGRSPRREIARRPTQPRPFPIRALTHRVSSNRPRGCALTSQTFPHPPQGIRVNDATRTECLTTRRSSVRSAREVEPDRS